jgi:hypothetical protein
MRYQDGFDASLPRRAQPPSGVQAPPWDGADDGGFQPGAYGNDSFDSAAYRGSGYNGPAYDGPGSRGPANRGYGNTGPQSRADDFDAFGGGRPRGTGPIGTGGGPVSGGFPRAGTGGFQRAATGGFPRAATGGFPSAGDATSVDEFTAIDGRLYNVTESDDTGRGRHRSGGDMERSWQRPAGRSRGLLAGGVSGFLAAGTALGVANLTAAFVRPQASPVIAVGGWFIDHTPTALKEFAIQKFGENDKNMLLLGMYVTIALIAIVIGMIAWRYFSIGIVGIGAFGAFGAFIAYTRPESRVTDVVPALIGGVLGIAVLALMNLWSTRHSASSSPRTAYRSEWAA